MTTPEEPNTTWPTQEERVYWAWHLGGDSDPGEVTSLVAARENAARAEVALLREADRANEEMGAEIVRLRAELAAAYDEMDAAAEAMLKGHQRIAEAYSAMKIREAGDPWKSPEALLREGWTENRVYLWDCRVHERCNLSCANRESGRQWVQITRRRYDLVTTGEE